jgi:hypothetical protein
MDSDANHQVHHAMIINSRGNQDLRQNHQGADSGAENHTAQQESSGAESHLAQQDFEFLRQVLASNQDKEIKRVQREKEIRESANQQLLESAQTEEEKAGI